MRIPWAEPCFWGGEKQAVADALRSTWISGGPYVQRLERLMARRHGVDHAVSCSSGTAALHMAFLACGIGPGSEVVVPGFGFLAAANMALALGARPVFADIDPATWCMDSRSVSALISPRTKAVVAVHTYGNMCDMTALCRITNRHRVWLIEDAAEALFSRYRGRYAGTFGDAGCFSFQATKTVTTAEGGCVLASCRKTADLMRLFRDHGMVRGDHYRHQVPGHNFRLTNLQAALGCAQMAHASRIIAARRKIRGWYEQYLKNVPGLVLQQFTEGVEPVVWCTAAALDPTVFLGGRDRIMKKLALKGIETRPGFYSPGSMPIYPVNAIPVADEVASRILALPCAASLTQKKVRYICDELKKAACS